MRKASVLQDRTAINNIERGATLKIARTMPRTVLSAIPQ
ncbi:hypothetical protein UUU_36800 (plasmid) [Klebsiella pneumoniae subsp. pneumoniae DSM 30104 = JCM 1662 = NBRC 14940]|nr:hypothetical protein UUU_36800 [Klebsiella pneumoniae subsp. pneumoniae DSM 30104 = JCM 1662 = NBRC 14940]